MKVSVCYTEQALITAIYTRRLSGCKCEGCITRLIHESSFLGASSVCCSKVFLTFLSLTLSSTV